MLQRSGCLTRSLRSGFPVPRLRNAYYVQHEEQRHKEREDEARDGILVLDGRRRNKQLAHSLSNSSDA
jgi:hypothetical protein